MKKLLLTTLMLFNVSLIYAQFTLTPKGLVNAVDSNDYAVLSFEGKTKEQLYSIVLGFLNKTNYTSNILTKTVENSLIQVQGESKNSVGKYKIGLLNTADMYLSYIISLDFKDSKLKFSVLKIEYLNNSVGSSLGFKLVGNKGAFKASWGIWDENLNLKHEWLKKGTENFFNEYVVSLKKAINEYDKW